MTFAKVCGLREEAQIDHAVGLGYDAIGVVLAPRSARYCHPERARALAEHARGRITTFAVALTYEQVAEVADAFDVVQVYEPVDLPNFALAGRTPPGGTFQYFVYDASHGSGVFEDFPDWVTTLRQRLVVAGGLDPTNVADVIARLRPFGVDVSSGVESTPGVKDPDLMARFIAAVRTAG